ncbi:MAG: DUF456 domain-containing protein [Caldilineaceae bacterium]|nr:DUF456 domain-containing protein [Caldilineaceae bacterium]
MTIDGQALWATLAMILVFIGLAGSVIPVLPGPFLIWLGAFIWAWADGFSRLGWGTLTVLGVLALVAWGSDLFLSTVMSRRAGASWKSIVGAIVGGLFGALALGWVPLLGSILGAILGAMAGMWLVEYRDKGNNAQAATAAVQAYISSMIVAAILEMTIALAMVGIFIYNAYL